MKRIKYSRKRGTNILVLITLLALVLLDSCTEIKTTNPNEVYKQWAGQNPPLEIELIKGQYWQSAHWNKEYEMYLKFKSTKVWWDEFIIKNKIPLDEKEWTFPSDAPEWFSPSTNSLRFGGENDFVQGSRYFRDTLTGICYIYEIQF